MRKKCILLVRVSTLQQDLDQQRNKVFEAAKSDGYRDSDIIVIEDKESAIKLSEEERHGLVELKNYINSDSSIDRVYSFELSRISRQAKMLYSIRDFLVSKGVDLVILNPYFHVLKEDKTLDPNSNIFFGIFASMSENEGFLSKIRQARGRAKAVAEGRFIGGTVVYGYKNEKGYLVPEPGTSNIVKEIFETYATGNHSLGTLAKEFNFSRDRIAYILSNPIYCGRSGRERKKPSKTDLKLQAIITEELYDKVQSIKEKNCKDLKKRGNNVYLCKSILKCSKCMKTYIAHLTAISYRCKCSESGALPINLMDSLAWHLAKESRKKKLNSSDLYEKELEKLQNSISIMNDRLNQTENSLIQINKKKDRLALLILNDKITKDLADRQDKEITRELKNLGKEKDSIIASISDFNNRIKNLSVESLGNPLDIENITDPVEMYRIIKEEIYSIVVMEKRKNSMIARIAVSYSSLDPDIDNSKIEFYDIDTKNRIVYNSKNKAIKYKYLERFELTENIKAALKKARENYNLKKGVGVSKKI